MKLTGKNRRTRGKTCPSATLPTTNSTWTDPGSNLGLRGGRPAANHLSHGTTIFSSFFRLVRLVQQPYSCVTYSATLSVAEDD
jgi:hypothetical protein